VVARIVHLPHCTKAELDALWRATFGAEPPAHSRAFLERRLAYRLQEDAFRAVEPERLERNRRRLEALVETGKHIRRAPRPVPGTVLTREYRGMLRHVVVTADGQSDFQGRPSRSLSLITRAITGTRWSGPLFVALKAPAKVPAKQRGGPS
jgi:hypothetical protein